jgi:uncharacterized protein YkwD
MSGNRDDETGAARTGRRAGPGAVALVALLALVAVACGAAPPATTAAPPAPAAATGATWQDAMLASVNAQRAAVGAAPLSRCGTLDRAAQDHSADQAATNTMTHDGSDGSTIGPRATRAGYVGWTALGENVAAGYTSVDAVMNGWMNSSGHRANILSTTYTHVGFGRADSATGRPYWTQDFGRSGTC